MKSHINYGFKHSPFNKDPLKHKDKLINYDREVAKLIYWTQSGNIINIIGPKNSGKTRLIKEVINKFKGKGKIIYVKDNKDFELEQLLIKNQNFIKKVLSIKPRDRILILDGYTKINSDLQKQIQNAFDLSILKSVIISSPKKISLITSLNDRLGNRQLRLKKLSISKQIQIIQQRINNEKFFSKKLLTYTRKKSKNFEEFLNNCQNAMDLSAKKSNKTITKKTINDVLVRK